MRRTPWLQLLMITYKGGYDVKSVKRCLHLLLLLGVLHTPGNVLPAGSNKWMTAQ